MLKKKAKSPITVVRDIKTINQEYIDTCFKVGQTGTTIRKLKRDIISFKNRIDELVKEGELATAEHNRKNSSPPEPPAETTPETTTT